MSKNQKSKYWVGVLYLENMVTDWETLIYDLIPFPFAYAIHDKDQNKDGSLRKAHMHLIVAFNNTTTYNHAFSVFELLSSEDKKAINKIERVLNVRNMYDYLIHDTEGSKKEGKHLYEENERVLGNNFDIGAFEQLSKLDKMEIQFELAQIIIDEGYTNYVDFFNHVMSNFSERADYKEVILNYSGFFERLTKGNYLKREDELKYRHRVVRKEKTTSLDDYDLKK